MKHIFLLFLCCATICKGQQNADSLYRHFVKTYEPFLGDYLTDNQELIVIGRSQIKLYAYFEKTNAFRGLEKKEEMTWTAGTTVKSDTVVQTFKFKADKIEVYEKGKLVTSAQKKLLYQTENVNYRNAKGIKLGGTLFIPLKPNGKAMVLVHGSGQQDRCGYASIIRLLADIFAREGITVLTYDKQGVGESEGNSEYESFANLGEDALAGITFLKTRKELRLSKIGLAGSSQAGWVIAKAIETNAKEVDFALTIGAAGSGISAIEQNLYNTEILMKCSGTYSQTQIENALKQQRYFFDYLANPAPEQAQKLDDFTHRIEKDTLLRDWLFPESKQIDLTNKNQWFTALEIGFEPLAIWKTYRKPVFMLFSEFDDSTPPLQVKAKVDKLKNKKITTCFLANAQHIGLETNALCKNEFSQLARFHQDFFPKMKDWLKRILA